MERKKYQAVLMDIDGTLLDFNKAEVLGVREVMKAYGVEPSEEKEEVYHRINQSLWKSFERGEIPKQQIMDTRFSLFFGELGVQADGILAEKLYRDQLDQGAFLLPGALEICQYLSGKYPLYVVTNGVSATQHKRLGLSGLKPYFKDIFVSEDAGSQKPQKEFFEYCFSRMPGYMPGDMIIIGDSLTSDIKGGCAAGTDTCWYHPEGGEKSDLPEGVRVDYEVKDLMDLKNIL